MELNNEFRVAVPAAKTWQVLTDVERVAPCIPGAQLLSVDGDDFTGAVKVKVGPITVSYKGDASFQEKDEAAQRVIIKASGKETRGSGTPVSGAIPKTASRFTSAWTRTSEVSPAASSLP